MSWYDLDSNVARVCTNKARIYSIKQGLSRFEHDLQNDFHTVVVRFQVRSSTVCYSLVRLNTTLTRLTGHLQGLHTVPPTFVRVMLELSHIRVCFDIKLTRFDGLTSQIFELSTEKVLKWQMAMYNSYLNRIGRMAVV